MTRKILTFVAALFILASVGCASKCDSPRMGLMDHMRNKPKLRDWFHRGSQCSTCNTHAGQIYGDVEMGFAGSQCPDGTCGSGLVDSSTELYGTDQMGPTRSSYPDYSGINGIPTTPPPGTGPAGTGTPAPRSNGELEMPPMYGNGR